jgi:hypothetical protein
MDAKITKKRLSALLSYDWLKIVGLCLALIIVWTLVFTVTATRMRPSQQFTVFNHQANLALDDAFYDHYSAISNDGVFSYEVIEQNVNDFASNREYARTLAEARLAVDEGDVMLVPGLFDPATAYKDENTGETAYHRTYVESFTYSFRANVWKVDDYLTGLEKYLNGFYDGGWEEGTLNESKVNTAFRARAKANKDKRFKKARCLCIKGMTQKDVRTVQPKLWAKNASGSVMVRTYGAHCLRRMMLSLLSLKSYAASLFTRLLCGILGSMQKLAGLCHVTPIPIYQLAQTSACALLYTLSMDTLQSTPQ